jgi:hypothetical protein
MIGYQQYRYKPKIEKSSPTNDWISAIQIYKPKIEKNLPY